jgi:uncharacterized protein (TIGR00255 family)
VNNRFCEISFKYPKYLFSRDIELKEIIKQRISRGKININLNIENGSDSDLNLVVNKEATKSYLKILKSLKKTMGTKEKIRLDHLLNFSDVFKTQQEQDIDEKEYVFICDLLSDTIDDLMKMKKKEGDFIRKDIIERIDLIESETIVVSDLSIERIPRAKEIFREKVRSVIENQSIIDEKRLELELILLSDKLDITEECTRLKSHISYFRECIDSEKPMGRRLNFLLQEMNREVNTIASKIMDSKISQKATLLKEELEKIREQIQNVE